MTVLILARAVDLALAFGHSLARRSGEYDLLFLSLGRSPGVAANLVLLGVLWMLGV